MVYGLNAFANYLGVFHFYCMHSGKYAAGIMEPGFLNPGSCIQILDPDPRDPGSWIQDLNAGSRALDPGFL